MVTQGAHGAPPIAPDTRDCSNTPHRWRHAIPWTRLLESSGAQRVGIGDWGFEVAQTCGGTLKTFPSRPPPHRLHCGGGRASACMRGTAHARDAVQSGLAEHGCSCTGRGGPTPTNMCLAQTKSKGFCFSLFRLRSPTIFEVERMLPNQFPNHHPTPPPGSDTEFLGVKINFCQRTFFLGPFLVHDPFGTKTPPTPPPPTLPPPSKHTLAFGSWWGLGIVSSRGGCETRRPNLGAQSCR